METNRRPVFQQEQDDLSLSLSLPHIDHIKLGVPPIIIMEHYSWVVGRSLDPELSLYTLYYIQSME